MPVSKGQFSVAPGDPSISGMQGIQTDVFKTSPLYLRVWFSESTTGFQRLDPDQRIAAVGYALVADFAHKANNASTATTAAVASNAT